MTKPLSPAAQAVVDAWDAKLNPDPDGLTYLTHDPEHEALAAALRAAADQAADLQVPWSYAGESYQTYDKGLHAAAEHLRAIAAELEAQ
jgi:hypothetical protein